MKFIACDSHDTQPMGNPIINLDLVCYIRCPEGEDFITFHFSDEFSKS